VYDSKKPVRYRLHLRFSPKSIHSPYLIGTAMRTSSAATSRILERYEMLDYAAEARILLNIRSIGQGMGQVTRKCSSSHRQEIEFYAIDAYAIAKATGMGSRINT